MTVFIGWIIAIIAIVSLYYVIEVKASRHRVERKYKDVTGWLNETNYKKLDEIDKELDNHGISIKKTDTLSELGQVKKNIEKIDMDKLKNMQTFLNVADQIQYVKIYSVIPFIIPISGIVIGPWTFIQKNIVGFSDTVDISIGGYLCLLGLASGGFLANTLRNKRKIIIYINVINSAIKSKNESQQLRTHASIRRTSRK